MRHAHAGSRLLPALVVMILLAACSTSKEGATADSATTSAVAADTSMAGMAGMQHDTMGSMSGMANMTGDPDRDFLRMMSDHHEGMIAMAHDAREKAGSGVKVIATRIDTKQDKELADMQAMLKKDFQDAYESKMMPEGKTMLDEMNSKSGAAFDKAFLEHTVMHHERAIKMVDEYLPNGKSPAIKQMARKIKADQAKEIAEFRAKAARM